MRRFLFICLLVSFTWALKSQEALNSEFHKSRREAFRQMMPENSVAFILSAPERLFANDVNYVFHQNPDYYYLTGSNETSGALLIFKEMQGSGSEAYNEVLFVRQRSPRMELFEGPRMGIEGARKQVGIQNVKFSKEFKDFPVDFGSFDIVIYDKLKGDAMETREYDVKDLYDDFNTKAKINSQADADMLRQILSWCKTSLSVANLQSIQPWLADYSNQSSLVRENEVVKKLQMIPDSAELEKIIAGIKIETTGPQIYNKIFDVLREVKTEGELALIRKAVEISCVAHNEVMMAATPAMSENSAHGMHLFVHKHLGSEDEGYPPIVGAGANGCILHYTKNDRPLIKNDMMLMDVGAQYKGYTADVTRTFPGNGKFSPEQKALYEIVYQAQEEIFKICKPGTEFGALNEVAKRVVGEGLLRLGIIKDLSETRDYYPHGCSHYLGLDVHDRGEYGPLKANSVITVEPGIYIPEGSPCDSKYWNIGIRIEDDVLITDGECEILSLSSPRKWDEIEKLMAKKSVLTDFKPGSGK